MITSTQNLVFEKTQELKATKKSLKMTGMKSTFDNSSNVLTFEELLLNNKDLYCIEDEEENTTNFKGTDKKYIKKEIKSYIANRDTLFIPYPEKPKRPIDISSRIIEEKPEILRSEIGMQSDQINFVDKTKPFIPQKIGKDVGVQIEDGDLFSFDIDVQPLLTVLIGKILEQTDLELREEEEIKKIREAKYEFLKRIKEDKLRIKIIEEEEIKLKKEMDNKKGLKLIEKNFKKNTQKQLVSRVFAKNFLKNFNKHSIDSLINQGLFINKSVPLINDKINDFIFQESEKINKQEANIYDTIEKLDTTLKLKARAEHRKVIEHQSELIRQQKLDEEKRIKEEEERKIRLKQERAEKRRLLKIKMFKDEIYKTILENPTIKDESYTSTDVSEIDNYENEGAFTGVYGGLMGIFLNTIEILKKNFYPQDSYYTADILAEVLNLYLIDGSTFNLYFKINIVEQIKQAINNEEIDIMQIKSTGKLSSEEWSIFHQYISLLENNYDVFFTEFIKNHVDLYNRDFYSVIIRALLILIEKSLHLEKINLNFKGFDNNAESISLQDKLSKYNGYCIIENSQKVFSSLERLEYAKDTKKKKAFKVPDLEEKGVKAFQKSANINILLYDKKVEFITRNKVLEAFLKLYHNKFEIDIDSKTIFKVFNEFYDANMNFSEFADKIQTFNFDNIHDYSNHDDTHNME